MSAMPDFQKQHEGVPELDAWRMIMDKGADFVLSPNTTAPLGQELDDMQPVGMTDLFAKLTPEDNSNIEGYWETLRPELEHLSPSKRKKVLLGLKVAYIAHLGQKRKSGEPFIIHPVAVGNILAGLKMDCDTVVAGLLHDTVEDTSLTFAQVEAFFGRTVRTIVEGETKVSKLPKIALSTYADEQAENLRQMFIAMTEDYRIIIVKLADRLHNMRTLRYMAPEKQRKISRETLDIFAPLAHRLGIWQVKSELEDTAFMYLYPREYRSLKKRLRRRHSRYQRALEQSKAALESKIGEDRMLADQAVHFEVTGRMKELYSLWMKMETKYERKLDRIQDVVALRVVLDPAKRPEESVEEWKTRGVWLCYHVVGLVHHLPGCQPVPNQVKDYISFPKPNGYQSLHTAIMREGQVVEVQIRTSWMHAVAEFGMASHWLYKEQSQLSVGAAAPKGARESSSKQYRIPWLNCINEWQHEIKSSREFVEVIRRELLGQRVFVFLRDGKILNLSRGAAVIDAAFQIHTEVGLNMVGAFINGQPMPLDYELRNGDVVSIQTLPPGPGEDPRPQPEWLRFAKSRSTRAKLRAHFRTRQRGALTDAGYLILDDFLRQYRPLLEEALGGVPDRAKLARLVRTRAPAGTTLDDFCMLLAHSEEEEVLELMSKALNVPAEKLEEFMPLTHDFWQPMRGSGSAGVNGEAQDAHFADEDHHHHGSGSDASAVDASMAPALNGANGYARPVNGVNGAAYANGHSAQLTLDTDFMSLDGDSGGGDDAASEGEGGAEEDCARAAPRGKSRQQGQRWGPGVGFMPDREAPPHIAKEFDMSAFSGQFGVPPMPNGSLGIPRLAKPGIGANGMAANGAPLLPPPTLRAPASGDARAAASLAPTPAVADEAPVHYADPHMLCPHCLPVRGDDIFGVHDGNGDITVHRRACPEAELQLLSLRRNYTRRRGGNRINSGVPGGGSGGGGGGGVDSPPPATKVQLEWAPVEVAAEVLYSAAISVYCADRKYLLSDVSTVVSKETMIVSTSSKTLGRDAMLNFTCMVRDLEHLQRLCESIMRIPSVLTCERTSGVRS